VFEAISTSMPSHPIYTHIGSVIKARRKTLRMKQEGLSSLLGISRGSLANIETGRQSILVHNLYKIAAVLELSPFDLLPDLLSAEPISSKADLPLPDNLKADQKEQVANLFLQSRRRILPTRKKHSE
jgi:transcriptional regulator with XRE-family HTH domain